MSNTKNNTPSFEIRGKRADIRFSSLRGGIEVGAYSRYYDDVPSVEVNLVSFSSSGHRGQGEYRRELWEGHDEAGADVMAAAIAEQVGKEIRDAAEEFEARIQSILEKHNLKPVR